MNKIDWLQAIGGFGIFFLSLRFLSNILSQSMASTIKPFLNRLLNTRIRCIFLGFFVTIFVQASSITIIAASGLLHTSLINLEQGFMIMLGATVGTTIKSWIFAISIHKYGAIIIGICSIILLFTKRPYFRAIIEMITAVGLAFLSLDMLSKALEPALTDPQTRDLLSFYSATSLSVQLWIVLISCLITITVQSSSAVIFIILEFVRQGVMPFPTGALCIFGANIGTTITPLIASIEYRRDVKRLAFAHFLVKVMGVLLTIFLFPIFLVVVDLIIPGSFTEEPLMHLAGVHTFFNLFNAIFWSIMTSLVIRFLFFLIPGKENLYTALPFSVRRMLASNPKQALKEVEKQIKRLNNMNKELTDYCLILLTEKRLQPYKSANTILIMRRFDNVRETIYELLLRLKSHSHVLSPQENKYIDKSFLWLDQSTNLYYWNLSFKDHIDRGMLILHYEFSPEIHQAFRKFQQHFNELWLLLLRNQPRTPNDGLTESLCSLKNIHIAEAMQKGEMNPKLYWIYDTIRCLEKMTQMFYLFNNPNLGDN